MKLRISCVAACLAAGSLFAAEPSARIAGSVTAKDGVRLPGVVLILAPEPEPGAVAGAAPAAIRVATGSVGSFRSPALPPGRYEIRASLPGFREAIARATVSAGAETTLDLRLEVAAFEESVSVVGEAPRGTLEASELADGPTQDLGDALGWKAGLWRLRKGGIAHEVVLRGLQSRDLNVLIDGQRVYGACPNHMDPAAFHVDFAEIERVEVGFGPFDVKNQGGLGGTVNVVTRKPERGWHARAALAAGSFDLLNPSLTLGRGGERLSALAGYSHRRSLGFRDGAGRRATEVTNYRTQHLHDPAFSIGTAFGRAALAPARGHQLDLAFTRQDAGAVLYPYLMMDALRDDTDRANLRYEIAGLGARQAAVRLQAYWTRVEHWMTDERRTSSLDRARPYSMGTAAETRTTGGKLELVASGLSLGLEGYERRWDATNEMAGRGYAPQAMIPGVRLLVGGAFAEYTRSLGRGLGLSAGARIDRARSQAAPALADTVLYQAYHGGAPLSAGDTLPAGKLRVAWRHAGLEMAAGIGHAPRAAEASERYLALRRMGSDWVGNPGLVPSRNTALDLALGITHAGFRLDAGLYRSRVADYVTVYDQPRRAVLPGIMNASARSFANVDASLRGGELALSLPILFGRVFVSGDLSLVRGNQDGDPSRAIAAGPLAEMPPVRGRLVARFDDGRFFGSLEGVFAADQSRVDPSLLETRTPGWGVMNLTAGYKRGRLKLTAGARNVFDRLYSDHLSYQRDPFRTGVRVPEPGRSLFLNASCGL